MIDVIGLVLVAVVVLWLITSATYQVGRFRTTLSRFDLLEILPSWAFFAPNPATRDSHLIIQDLQADGTLSGWTTTTGIPERTLRDIVWNPSKRPRKVLRDATKSLQQTRRRANSEGVVQCSLAYLVVLHYCLQSPPLSRSSVARQFAVVESSGRDNRRLWVTFISVFHRL